MATYCISDLHGQFHMFEKLLEKVSFSENDFLYVLGDAIDRGDGGIEILLKVMESENMDLLIGNHEFMMLNSIALDGSTDELPGRNKDLWLYRNGGLVTFNAYRNLSEDKRKELIDWLLSRHLTKMIDVNGNAFCLTHSYFNEEYIEKEFKDIDYDTIWNIVWNTPYRYDIYVPVSDYAAKPWTFVIGHVPVQRIAKEPLSGAYHEENIYVIDGGCSYRETMRIGENEYGGICIRLDDMKETVVTFEDIR